MAVVRQPANRGNVDMLVGVGGEQDDFAQPSTSPDVLSIAFLELASWMLQRGRVLDSGLLTNAGFVGQPKNPATGFIPEMAHRKGPWCVF